MRTPRPRLEAVLDAAARLLCARAGQMLTPVEWDALADTVADCRGSEGDQRGETFWVDDSGALVRSVIPLQGDSYQHRCPVSAYESVAHAVAAAKGGFSLEDLRAEAGVPWSQAGVALAFLKERSVVVPAADRRHIGCGPTPFEDAMIEYHALHEKPAGD